MSPLPSDGWRGWHRGPVRRPLALHGPAAPPPLSLCVSLSLSFLSAPGNDGSSMIIWRGPRAYEACPRWGPSKHTWGPLAASHLPAQARVLGLWGLAPLGRHDSEQSCHKEQKLWNVLLCPFGNLPQNRPLTPEQSIPPHPGISARSRRGPARLCPLVLPGGGAGSSRTPGGWAHVRTMSSPWRLALIPARKRGFALPGPHWGRAPVQSGPGKGRWALSVPPVPAVRWRGVLEPRALGTPRGRRLG